MSFSIIAFDKTEGLYGSAVASNLMAIGGAIPVYRTGVGLVHTQGQVFPKGAESLLDNVQGGISLSKSLDLALQEDKHSSLRQYLACDFEGNFATHSGDMCDPIHKTVISKNCVAGGNILNHPDIVDEMVDVYEKNSALTMEERLLLSLERAEQLGGDVRGTKSASLNIYSRSFPQSDKRLTDLRVDFHVDPIAELKILYQEFTRDGIRRFMH
jgi:uncharacterized Ntn-hydrolase superfamily protein